MYTDRVYAPDSARVSEQFLNGTSAHVGDSEP